MNAEHKIQELKNYLEKQNISQKDLSAIFNISQPAISALLNGKKAFGKKSALLWEEKLGLSSVWLLTGEGEMLRNNQIENNNLSKDTISMGKVIPFYDAEAAAGSSYAVSVDPVSKPIGMIEIGGFLRDSESALRVYGNSMTPSYPAGCIVGLKPHHDRFIEPGNVYVIETTDNRYLKRLYYNDEKTGFQCISDNHMVHEAGPRIGRLCYPEFDIPFDDVRRLFRVVGVIKRNIL